MDPLESLVCSLLPQARTDDVLRSELVSHSEDILNSHIGQARESDIGHLADQIKRHLLQSSPSGASSLRFTNLLSRLLEQTVLSRKHASLSFLHSLASSQSRHVNDHTSSFLPTLAPPPAPSRPSSAAPTPIDTTSRARVQKGQSVANKLREHRSKNGHPHIPEHLLLRDTLYLLQGISGKYVQFSHSEDEDNKNTLVFFNDSRCKIPQSTKALIHRLAEVGHLYIRVETFVREREGRPGVGMIEQSLCHHLQSQLTEYYKLIAILESQMGFVHKTDPKSPSPLDLVDVREEETGLTLKRLDVWINEWRLRMRMMSVCVEGAKDTHGGALVNMIHGYTDNGDPFIRKFTDQLLEEVSKPFFAILHKWIFSGELYDPCSEFFVAMDPELANMQYGHPSSLPGQSSNDAALTSIVGDVDDLSADDPRSKLWEAKYQFQQEMLPSFVGEVFGKKIFSTGKSLNFIRYSCHDSDWVTTRERLSTTGDALKYSDIVGLERSIDAAYQIASKRLFDVFFEKFKLLDHLLALKHYLMLGYGDFADHLMEALAPNLSRPANTLHRHNLTATLDTAIRSSNAQNDPSDVVRRLDARMLEYSHGEIGWDVFTLEYKVDAPINTVLDSDCMIKYLKLFNHLWKMKRIESTLSKTWMRLAGASRTFLRLPELEYQWHKIRIVMAEMIHFIRQTQAYCQLEVIECSWKVLFDFIQQKEGDLDALIDAHRSYLERMVNKVLLLSPKAGREENLLNQLRDLFTIILQFRDAIDNFYNYCLTEASRRDSARDAERGVYTGAEAVQHEEEETSDTLNRTLRRIREYGSSFSEKTQALVHGLQTHPDSDCRLLGIRLSFTDFYKTKKDLKA